MSDRTRHVNPVRLLLVPIAAALIAAGCGGESGSGTNGGDAGGRPSAGVRVGVVIKGLDNPFFAAMQQGVLAAAHDHGTDVRVSAASGLNDTAGQASKLEALVDDDLSCYVANPITQSNLVQPLSHVPDGTPIVNIDSPVGADEARALGIDISTYIGTDNKAAGRLAAEAMAGLVGDGARVGVIGGISGDATSAARIEGFGTGARGRFTALDPVSADWDERKAMLAAEALLRSEPGIGGFFAANDQMALGIARAVGQAGRRGRVAIVGVDGIRQALRAVRRGAISATVSQYPYTIGRLGVEACLAAASGKTLPARVDAPVQVVTRRNVRRAQARFPEPVEPFASPFARLLGG
jgi:ABC-type sugar transport system substrate-binding protein